jgi:hypothetical protein
MMSSSQSRFALVIATCLGRNLSRRDIHSLARRIMASQQKYDKLLLRSPILTNKIRIRHSVMNYVHTGLGIVNESNLNQYLQSSELCSIIPAYWVVAQNIIML